MPSDQHPDRLRLVVEPDQRLDPGAPRRDSRHEPRLSPGGEQRAGDADAELRLHRVGGVDPMAELDDIDEAVETDADPNEGDAEDKPRRGRWLPIATAVLALLGFAGIVWYAYQWGAGSVPPEELPVIRAETQPSKIRPESPGGLEVPYQENLALNDVQPDPEKPQVERLLPPPETPMAPPAPAAVPAQGTVETAPAAPSAPAAPAPTPTADAQSVETAPAVPAVPPAPAAAPTQTAVAATGGYVLQLASLKAKDRAAAEWSRLQKSFPGLLGDRQLVVLPVDLGARGTFYRVQAGYFADRASADAVCQQLKAKRQDCLVTKR